MITDSDIEKLKETFPTREEHESDIATLIEHMATKEDLRDMEIRLVSAFSPRFDSLEKKNVELDEKFNRIMNTVDKLCEPIATLRQELDVSARQYERQVAWNHKVAKKVNVPFDY